MNFGNNQVYLASVTVTGTDESYEDWVTVNNSTDVSEVEILVDVPDDKELIG